MGISPLSRSVRVSGYVFVSLVWPAVCLRLYVRARIVRKLDWDDFFLLLTLLIYTPFVAFLEVTASEYTFSYGPGTTLAQMYGSIPGLDRGSQYFFLAEVFYIISSGTLRTSVAILLLRICSKRAQRLVIYITLGMMLCLTVAFAFVTIFQCNPVSYYWNYSPFAVGHCHYNLLAKVGYAHAAVSSVADWVFGLIPVWLLWKVQIGRRQKIGIACLLGLGLLGGVACILRVPWVYRFLNGTVFEKNWPPLALCSIIEPGFGLLAASLAAYRPLFKSTTFVALRQRLIPRNKSVLSRTSAPPTANMQMSQGSAMAKTSWNANGEEYENPDPRRIRMTTTVKREVGLGSIVERRDEFGDDLLQRSWGERAGGSDV